MIDDTDEMLARVVWSIGESDSKPEGTALT